MRVDCGAQRAGQLLETDPDQLMLAGPMDARVEFYLPIGLCRMDPAGQHQPLSALHAAIWFSRKLSVD